MKLPSTTCIARKNKDTIRSFDLHDFRLFKKQIWLHIAQNPLEENF